MKRRWSALGVLFFCGSLTMISSGCSDGSNINVTSGNLEARVNLLFADSGTLTPVIETAKPGTESADEPTWKYTLTLENLSEEVLWYAERPGRQSGSVTVQNLMALWSGMYGSVPPNAVLDGYVIGETSHQGLFLMLERPSYDSEKGHLLFQATLLDTTIENISLDSPLQMEDIKVTVLDNSPENETDNWSFAQVAPNAFFETTQTEGVYKLYLNNVYPESYYLGNAPNRRSYLYTVACLATNWWEVFGDDSPNASMTSYTEEGELNVHMLTIDAPEYDEDTDTVIYTATLLHGVIEDHQTFHSSTLFIEGQEEPASSTLSEGEAAASTHTIQVKNNCARTVWMSACGNAKEGGGYFDPPKGANVELASKHNAVFHVTTGWQGRFWPRTGCKFDKKGLCKDGGVDCCDAGGCNNKDHQFAKACFYSGSPPVLTIEATFDASSGNGPIDYFDTSMVDGYNVLMSIAAIKGTHNTSPDPGMDKKYWCTTAGCNTSPECPKFLKDAKGNCWSPCQHATQNHLSDAEQRKLCCKCTMDTPCTCPDECCKNSYGCSPYIVNAHGKQVNPPDMCCDPWGTHNNNRPWEQKYIDYIEAVKKACPEVYAWQFDDFRSTINCRKTKGLVDYQLTICP